MFGLSEIKYKKKVILLFAGGLVFLLICYLMAFDKTIEAYQLNKEYQKGLVELSLAPKEIYSLRNQLTTYNKNLGMFELDSSRSHEIVLALVSEFCEDHKITLREFPYPLEEQRDDLTILSYQFSVEGGFIQLLELLYFLEMDARPARIASVKFKLEKDRKNRSDILFMHVWLQNIIFNKHES